MRLCTSFTNQVNFISLEIEARTNLVGGLQEPQIREFLGEEKVQVPTSL